MSAIETSEIVNPSVPDRIKTYNDVFWSNQVVNLASGGSCFAFGLSPVLNSLFSEPNNYESIQWQLNHNRQHSIQYRLWEANRLSLLTARF